MQNITLIYEYPKKKLQIWENHEYSQAKNKKIKIVCPEINMLRFRDQNELQNLTLIDEYRWNSDSIRENHECNMQKTKITNGIALQEIGTVLAVSFTEKS